MEVDHALLVAGGVGTGLTAVGIALGLGLSCFSTTSIMVGTCVLPTVIGIASACLAIPSLSMLIAGYKGVCFYPVEGRTKNFVMRGSVIISLGTSLVFLTLGYAALHIGLGSVYLTKFSTVAALGIEAAVAFSLASILFGGVSKVLAEGAEAQSLETGVVFGVMMGLFLAASTVVGPALSIALGVAGTNAVVLECFISIAISMPALIISYSVNQDVKEMIIQ